MVPGLGGVLSRVLLEDGGLVQAERGRGQPRTFWNSGLLAHATSLGNEARLEETEAQDRASSLRGMPSPAGGAGPAREHTDLHPGWLLPGPCLEVVTALSSLEREKGKPAESQHTPVWAQGPSIPGPRKEASILQRSGHSRYWNIKQPRSPHVPPELTKLPFPPSAHRAATLRGRGGGASPNSLDDMCLGTQECDSLW